MQPQLKSAAGPALKGAWIYSNFDERTPMSQDDRGRLEEYAEYLPGLTKCTQIYVEGLPKRVGTPGAMGVRALVQLVEEILQWELLTTTEYSQADIVMYQRFPTE
jgi:hypothetical protein